MSESDSQFERMRKYLVDVSVWEKREKRWLDEKELLAHACRDAIAYIGIDTSEAAEILRTTLQSALDGKRS
jgi:hypothetical protein